MVMMFVVGRLAARCGCGSAASDCAFAFPRYFLLDYSVELPGSRLLPDAYGVNRVEIAIPMSQEGGLDYISEFIIEEEPALPTWRTRRQYEKGANHNNETNYRYKIKLCRHFEPLSPANVTTSLIEPPTPQPSLLSCVADKILDCSQ
jgi:hypothetical protein